MSHLNGPFLAPRSGKAKQLVIFLHGYGANGDDLLSIGDEWAGELPDAAFVSPNAPDVCEMSPMGFQWFTIRALSGSIDKAALDRKDLIARPAAALNEFIDAQLKKWGVDESSLAVVGFSQGALMAMYTTPRRKKPCAGIIGYSGLLADAAGLKAPGIVKMPVLAIHGDADGVVPPAFLDDVRKGFEEAGFDIETVMRPRLGHGIDEFGLTRGLSFLQEVFEKQV